jgi:hypothetical protein
MHGIIFVAPGWLFAGTITESQEYLTFTDAVWCETVESGTSIFDLCTGKDPSKVILSSWPVADGTRIRREAASIIVPIPGDVRVLVHARAIAAVKGAK